MRLLPLFILALSPLAVHAAEVTDMPAELQGSLAVDYGGYAEWGALLEGDTQVSQRRILRNDVDYTLSFAPAEGMALVVGLSQTAGVKYSYPDARRMTFEPVSGGGTYLLSDEQVAASTTGSGLNGVWIGAAFAPFSELYERGQRSSWRLDVAFRTGSPSKNLWVAKDGKRGSAPGGSALRVSAAVSQDLGVGNPYMKMTYVKENKFTADLADESGTVWAKGVELQPASTFEAISGIEIVGLEDTSNHTRFALDLFLGFGYRTYEDVTTGVYLPNVLDNARGTPITVGDYTSVRTGILADYHVNENVRARTGPEFIFHAPFRPEHPYDLITKPSQMAVAWTFKLEGLAKVDNGSGVESLEDLGE